jgi:type II secretory pathway component PulC
MNEEKIAPQEAEPVQEVKPYEFYLEGIKSKQIFSSASRPEETARPASAASADLIKGINLVGIISGDRPQAIIEDKIMQKTYYVAKGQFVGAFQVEDIQEGKVILSYRGERFELYL